MIRKASVSDINEMLAILEPYTLKGVVLRRSYDEISETIDHFYVCETEGRITGLSAYYSYSKNLVEIRSLAVKQAVFAKGIGRRLVKKIISDIHSENPSAKIFALTLVPDFFIKCGFSEVEKATLPEKIWKDCSKCLKQDKCDEIPMVYSENTR